MSVSSPSSAYAAGVASGAWLADPAQQALLPELDRVQRELLATQGDGVLGRLAAKLRAPEPARGLYLWGGVGRGKTFLADLLHDSLAAVPRQRWHFHRFMGEVHARLKALPNTSDTLSVVGADLASEMRLLVLDEFFVSDIGDAMILGRLLERLFERGVTLVTTSNIPPPDLYRDGLQRASFLPAIALLEKHCAVRELAHPRDYRLRQLTRAATYLTPLGPDSEAALAAHFERLTATAPREPEALDVNGRTLTAKSLAQGVAWFEFAALCEGPRAVSDYIELARDFHTVLVSNVPRFSDDANLDPARRFVHLVDEFYDRHVNLLVSAAADALSLYSGMKLEREFERTGSRLVEMQQQAYLAREHRP
jgi:cell division protein ZapE